MMMSACLASSCTIAVCNCVSNNEFKESEALVVSESRREAEDKRSIRTVFQLNRNNVPSTNFMEDR